jgi:hypothetical protein
LGGKLTEKLTSLGGTPPTSVIGAPTQCGLNCWRTEEKMQLCQSEKRCNCQALFEQLREIRELRELVQMLEAKAANQAGKSSRRSTKPSRREHVRNDTIEAIVA